MNHFGWLYVLRRSTGKNLDNGVGVFFYYKACNVFVKSINQNICYSKGRKPTPHVETDRPGWRQAMHPVVAPPPCRPAETFWLNATGRTVM